jgi:hypothetical protein
MFNDVPQYFVYLVQCHRRAYYYESQTGTGEPPLGRYTYFGYVSEFLKRTKCPRGVPHFHDGNRGAHRQY